jgi:hypothetical protein
MVEAGMVRCARCGEVIERGAPWDLGHVDATQGTVYSGPEHRRCNRATRCIGASGISRASGRRSRQARTLVEGRAGPWMAYSDLEGLGSGPGRETD